MLLINNTQVDVGNFSVNHLPSLQVEFETRTDSAWLKKLAQQESGVQYEFHFDGEWHKGRAVVRLFGSEERPKFRLSLD